MLDLANLLEVGKRSPLSVALIGDHLHPTACGTSKYVLNKLVKSSERTVGKARTDGVVQQCIRELVVL